MLEGKSIGLIGAGVMAEVIASGLLNSKLVEPDSIVMSHYRQDRLDELHERLGVATSVNNRDAYERSDIAVLCVRPQAMAIVLQELRTGIRPNVLLITIAAGLPIAFYESRIG